MSRPQYPDPGSGGEERRRRGHHRRHGCAAGPRGDFGGPPFGGWGHFGPRGRGRKARRGDIRTAALLLLAEEPRNGYQIMQEVEERSGGLWRPSPGSVYPALAQLEDEGLVRSEEADGRRHYALTDAGREHVAERPEDAPAPWEQIGGGRTGEMQELGQLVREVAFAFSQLMRHGGEKQRAQARDVLATTRRDLYRILADGEEGAGSDGEDA